MEALLEYFQRIATPGLDAAAEAVTMLGEEYFIIAVVSFVYWNLSKKEGFKLAAVFIFSSLLNNVLKITFRSPRPFEKLDFIRGKRLETATGYSFPSGHSQGAAALFTAAALHVGRWWAAAAAALASVAVGLSRIYLGVHWPVDAAGGIILGAAAALFFCPLVDRLFGRPEVLRRVLLGITAAVAPVTLGLFVSDILFFKGSLKIDDFFKISGVSLGFIGGFFLQSRYADFDPGKGSRAAKAIRYLAGAAAAAAMLAGLRRVFPEGYLFTCLRYALAGLWAVFLWPWLGLKAGLFDKLSAPARGARRDE